jgi:hypothetical protein
MLAVGGGMATPDLPLLRQTQAKKVRPVVCSHPRLLLLPRSPSSARNPFPLPGSAPKSRRRPTCAAPRLAATRIRPSTGRWHRLAERLSQLPRHTSHTSSRSRTVAACFAVRSSAGLVNQASAGRNTNGRRTSSVLHQPHATNRSSEGRGSHRLRQTLIVSVPSMCAGVSLGGAHAEHETTTGTWASSAPNTLPRDPRVRSHPSSVFDRLERVTAMWRRLRSRAICRLRAPRKFTPAIRTQDVIEWQEIQ